MKKFIYIMTFAITMILANKAFAQESPDQGLKNLAKGAIFAEDCEECIAQQQDIVSILNYYNLKFKWGYETFKIGNIGGVVDQSRVVFGSTLKGRISIHSVQDDGTIDAMEKVLPKPMDRFLSFNNLPYAQIVTRKKIEVVKFEKDEIPTKVVADVPRKEREQKPQKIVTNDNDDQHTYTDQNNNGDIIIEVHCDHKTPKETPKVEDNEQRYSYNNTEYVQRNNGWVEYSTGVMVGSSMCSLLNGVVFNTGYQYPQYRQQQPRYNYNTCGGGYNGHHAGSNNPRGSAWR